MTYDLRLLGRFQLRAASGGAVPVSAKKSQALIALLALAEGAPVPRSRLMGILWGERGEDQARSSLRQAFTALRKVFAATGENPLQVDDEQAALDLSKVEVDTQRFCALRREDPAGAAALWCGGFLEGLSIPDQAVQDWLQAERQRFQSLYLESLSQLMAAQAAASNFGAALASAQQLLKTDPLDEAAQRMVMRCHLEEGERTKALRQYQDFSEVLARELDIAPDPETRGLYEEIRGNIAVGAPHPAEVNPGKATVRPSIAVLPFESLSTDAEQGYLADGLTRELINELGRFSHLEVIAAATMFAFKDGRVAAAVGREVAADYVLEGSLQSAAGRMRVSAQLTDVATGRQVWGNHYEGDAGDPFALQDELVRKISGNLYHPLMKSATAGAHPDPAEDRAREADLQNLYLRSYSLVERPSAEGLREARRICAKVVELDPGFALIYGHLVWISLHSSYNGWIEDPWQGFRDARHDAFRGIALEEQDGGLCSALGLAEVYLGNHRRGLEELQKAVGLNPNHAEYPIWLGIGLTVVGRLDEALTAFDEAERLSPGHFPINLFRGDALFAAGEPRAAIPCYDQFLAVLPEYNWALAGKAAAHMECQEPAAAREAVARLRGQSQRVTCDYLKRLLQARQPAVVDRLLTALEASGLPPGGTSPRPEEGKAAPAESPRIAVLPFENMSGDPEQAYFSDGLTEDIITELSRFKSLFVIARHSSFTFKGKAVDVARVAEELGVRYVVEGSLRRAGKRIRVSAQLIDADSGKQLWAERYDRDIEDVFAVQDEITQTIVGTVWGRVEAAGFRRAGRLSPADLKAYDLTLQGRALVLNFDKADNAKAVEVLEAALGLDPENTNALTTLALAQMMDWVEHWVAARPETIERARNLARKAIALDESDSRAWWQLGEIELLTGHHEDARIALEKALALNPNDIEGRAVSGMYHAATGEFAAATREFDEIKRRNPIDFSWVPWLRGYTCVIGGRYGEAIATFKELTLAINEVHFWLAIAYAHNGDAAEARRELNCFLEKARTEMAVVPGPNAADWEDYCRSLSGCYDRALVDPLLDGLRKAGMPG